MIGQFQKQGKPMETNDHPEEDTSNVLDDDMHRKKHQILIGILNWLVTIGRMDIAYAVSSMSRFSSCPREGHLIRVMKIFGYLKKYPNHRILVDFADPVIKGDMTTIKIDYVEAFRYFYPDAHEEIDVNIPAPRIDEMKIICFVDSDHAHNKVTRRSITGLVFFVGRTPVYFSSKWQGAIETSTYGVEFCAMKLAVEELIAVRYMLRFLGVKVLYSSIMCGDKLEAVQNCTMPSSLLKK